MRYILKILTNPLISPVIVVSAISLILFVAYIPRVSNENKKTEMIKEATNLVTYLKSFRDYYTQNVINILKQNSTIRVDFDYEDRNDTIPLPITAIHDLSKIIGERDNLAISFYSDYPFLSHKDRVLDSFQKEAISILRTNPKKEYFFKEEVIENRRYFRVAIPDFMSNITCVECHNNRPDSQKRDWKIGEIRGVIEIKKEVKDGLLLFGEQSKYLFFFLTALSGILIIHYTVLYILRRKEMQDQKRALEIEVEKRTKELQDSNTLLIEYKKAVDASAIVSKTDKDGVITYVNDAFCEITGYTKEELLGKKHNIIRHPDMPDEFFKNLWETITKKEIFKGIVKNRKKDGSSYYVKSTIVPILDKNGEISEYLSIRYDITELIHAKERAEKAERAKSQFLANMSHEIRTPLNGIIGFADILSSSNLPPKEHEYAQIIATSAKSLLAIINDILDFSKIESGSYEIVPEAGSLIELCNSCVVLFSAKAEQKGVSLQKELDINLPEPLLFDGTRLQQVLSNLISNAIKFTPSGGEVKLRLTKLDQKDSNVKVLLEVIDSGIGIPKEKQKSIFEPFVQADGGVAKKYGGTGLGLAISSKIIELMGSQIKLESSEGKGSRFFFELTLEIASKKIKKNEDAFKKVQDINFSGAKLLVAEDNPVNRKLMDVMLKKVGIEPIFAVNGVEAVDKFIKDSFDLILMDVNMPEMDGISATQEIREIEKQTNRKTIIIALTANAIEGDRERFLEAGMDDYLSKPIDFNGLVEMLKKYLKS